MVMSPLVQHPQYQAAVLPLRVATAFYARYQPGMTYGFHVDDPVMGPMSGRYRTDVSTTVFLNDDYEGGEIVIRTAYGEQKIRGAAAVSYTHLDVYKRQDGLQRGSKNLYFARYPKLPSNPRSCAQTAVFDSIGGGSTGW